MMASGGHHAQLHVGEEGARDDHAVGEVVERVAEDDHPGRAPAVVVVLEHVRVRSVRAGAVVAHFLVVVMVVVAPEEQLLEDEEHEEPAAG